MNWRDDYILGHPEVDAMHDEFVALVHSVQQSPDGDLQQPYAVLLDHLRRHFGAEDRLMVESGFPPRQCHIDEHAAVLNSACEVQVRLARGNVTLCRALIAELVRWFPGHAQHLDSALVHWISKSRLGGKPLVFRRIAGQGPE